MLDQKLAHSALQRQYDFERAVVALRLGQRREPDEVGEQEGVRQFWHLGYRRVCKSHTAWYVK